ncbi:hypothetical protein BGX26_005571 [Mortierella sp. AD094]|nr:hypothetical protein BGX26_005571 [Mortierella sp. AD094]
MIQSGDTLPNLFLDNNTDEPDDDEQLDATEEELLASFTNVNEFAANASRDIGVFQKTNADLSELTNHEKPISNTPADDFGIAM